MKKLNVLIIAPPLIKQSGWGRYSLAVINELKSRANIHCSVLAEAHSRAEKSECAFKSAHTIVGFLKNLYTARQTARTADIVHVLEGWPYAFYGYMAVLGTKKKLFINIIGTYSIAPFSSRIKNFLLTKSYTRAAAIFSISRYTAMRLNRVLPLNNVHIVHLGKTDLPSLSDGINAECLQKYPLGHVNPCILSVGEIKYRKGQLVTLQALPLLLNEYPNIKYIVIGKADPEYLAEMKAYCEKHDLQKHFEVYEDIHDDRVLRYFYSHADIVTLTSQNDGDHFEGFGIVLIEAASFGIPTIGSRDSGIEDAVRDGYNGLLVPQGDSQAVAEAVRTILQTDTRAKFKTNARTFSEPFTWAHTVDSYIHFYQKTI